ncbi:OmpP1/FadL family transporter [Polaribacter sp. AHE13PA]|uniref:OmpP1/FadL family transporter n=1 Tax=Polaribacter sp. AHE13PA TaxID=2745562 RepID=UPI001C4E5310|nr:outer membrane protein transport protein [Polaribacter sp. AHE13PA]QXP66712.1 outer membrane protein transport protein [Polaribacter sp. AHE13PA]
MKKIITIAILFAATVTSYSQSLRYQDLGVLFSKNDDNGSARFTAMSGAFGALGGDVSAMSVNPAGISVFTNSYFTGTINSRNTDISAKFGDANFNDRRKTTTDNKYFNLSHAGAVLVFDSAYKSDWNKFAIGFNYRITNDFEDSFSAQGNEAVTRFDTNPRNPGTIYNFTDGQLYDTNYNGETTELNIAFSSVHRNKLHVGLGLNFYDLNFTQQSVLTELNSDEDGNILDVELYQENLTTGTGFSANAGFIYKANQNFRFGLAYQTPTWYTEILQDTNYNQDSNIDIGETAFFLDEVYSFSENNPRQFISYKLKTPSKITASAAFIFGKDGLISLDYINKNYKNIKLSNGDFNVENEFFENDLRNTHSLNIGTEWRMDRFSLRGGYKFEQDPSKSSIASDNLKGYSLGAGYNFGNMKLDFSFSDNNRTGVYNLYSNLNTAVNPSELKIDNKTITASISFNL